MLRRLSGWFVGSQCTTCVLFLADSSFPFKPTRMTCQSRRRKRNRVSPHSAVEDASLSGFPHHKPGIRLIG